MESKLGHNQPPTMAITAAEVVKDLSAWMAEHPVIETEGDARAAKVLKDRAYLCLQDMDDERKTKVRPLNDQILAINETYKQPRGLLEKVLGELKVRFRRFIEGEEEKRRVAAEQAEAERLRRELLAREAEGIEQDAIGRAASGEFDVDVAAVTADADKAFAAYQKAERQAKVAERETKVRIGGGFKRAIGLRSKEELTIRDAVLVFYAVGDMPEMKEALLKAARAYKRMHGRYPNGIEVTIERRI